MQVGAFSGRFLQKLMQVGAFGTFPVKTNVKSKVFVATFYFSSRSFHMKHSLLPVSFCLWVDFFDCVLREQNEILPCLLRYNLLGLMFRASCIFLWWWSGWKVLKAVIRDWRRVKFCSVCLCGLLRLRRKEICREENECCQLTLTSQSR